MKRLNQKKCLLCGSPDYRVIFSYGAPDRYEKAIGIDSKDYFRKWVKCTYCNFYYSIYSRSKNAIDKIYASAYRDTQSSWRVETPEQTFRKITALPFSGSETKFRVKWIKDRIGELWTGGFTRKNPPPGNVLDIGGGAGIFAYEFQDKHWKAHIVDPTKNNDFIKTKLHISLVQDFYKPHCFKRKFNLVSMIYLLEHVGNPKIFLKNVRKDLSMDSLIYIEVPDSIAFRLKPKTDDIFNSCHLWMFDPETLARLLKKCEFEIFTLHRLKTLRGHYALMALAKPLI